VNNLTQALLALSQAPSRHAEEFLLHNISQDPLSHRVFGISADTVRPACFRRLKFFERCSSFCSQRRWEVCGHEVRASMYAEELWRFYAPLCLMLLDQAGLCAERRFLLGLAGPPGSGKSVTAAILAALINAHLSDDGIRAATCALDGFHLPNQVLDDIITDSPGLGRLPLRRRKGCPETFDAIRFAQALKRLRKEPRVSLPVYDRKIHDPVAGRLVLGTKDRIVIVEGNYLLLDSNEWKAVGPQLGAKWFLRTRLPLVRESIIARHILGGRSRQDAERHFREVDVPNFEIVMATMKNAELVIKRGPDHQAIDILRQETSVT